MPPPELLHGLYPSLFDKGPSGLAQLNMFSVADKQRPADEGLQILNVLGEHRLTDANLARSALVVQFLGKSDGRLHQQASKTAGGPHHRAVLSDPPTDSAAVSHDGSLSIVLWPSRRRDSGR